MQTTKPVIHAGPGQYEPGDIVVLITGSRSLTVVDVCGDCGNVEIAYTDSQGDIVFETLPAICLELAS